MNNSNGPTGCLATEMSRERPLTLALAAWKLLRLGFPEQARCKIGKTIKGLRAVALMSVVPGFFKFQTPFMAA